MNDQEYYQTVANDLDINDLPEESQKEIIERFSETLLARLMVEVGSGLTPEQQEKFSNSQNSEERVTVLEEAYGQSFEEINEAIYQNLVQEFRDLMK